MTKYAFIFTLFLLSIKSFSQLSVPEDSIRSLFAEEHYDELKNYTNELIHNHLESRTIWYYLGKVHEARCNYDSASVCYTHALSYDTLDFKTLNALAFSYLKGQRLTKAKIVFYRLLAIYPESIEAEINLAIILSRLGYDKMAKEFYVQLVASDSTNPYFLSQLAGNYLALGITDSAKYFFEKSLRLNPEDFSSLIRLWNLYVKEGSFQKGLCFTRNYLECDSSNIMVLKLNAYFYFLLNQYDLSVQQFNKCAKLGDSSFMTMKYLGLSYYQKQDMYGSIPYLNKAFLQDTSDIETCMYLGISIGWTIDKEKGIEYLKKVFQLMFPDDESVVKIYRQIADLYVAWSKPEIAVDYYMKILDYSTDNRIILFKLGNCFEYIDKQKALSYYKEFMKTKNPKAAPVTTNVEGLYVVSYYDIAARKIQELTEELFFKGELDMNK